MKEVLTIATNTVGNITVEGKLTASVEIALVLSEPQYGYDQGGTLTRQRITETFRFMATTEVMRKLADQLETEADNADADLEKAIAKTKGEEA